MTGMIKPPKHIYLQNYCENYLDLELTTWCEDKQSDDDIEYILKTEYNKLLEEYDSLLRGLMAIHDEMKDTVGDKE